MALQDFVEEVQVLGRDLVDKVKSLIHEANVQRIIIKDVHGNTFVETPFHILPSRETCGEVFHPSPEVKRFGFPPSRSPFPMFDHLAACGFSGCPDTS